MPVGGDGMPWRFRQKAAFVFGRGPGRPRDGPLRPRHERRGARSRSARCTPERANRIAFALRDALAAAGIPASGPATTGLARHVVVRTSRDEKEAVAMLVATRDDPALQAPLRAVLDGAEKPEGLVLNLHDRPGPYLVGRESKRVAGTGPRQGGGRSGPPSSSRPRPSSRRTSRPPPRSCGWWSRRCPASAGLRVLDLYSGGGLFALPLALRGHQVTAVEESRKSVQGRRAQPAPERRDRGAG